MKPMRFLLVVSTLVVLALSFRLPASAAPPVESDDIQLPARVRLAPLPQGMMVAPQATEEEEEGEREPTVYVVEASDTLSGIARRFGVDMATLMKVNAITGDAVIRVGQQIIIPGSDGSLPDLAQLSHAFAPEAMDMPRDDLPGRMTRTARRAGFNSPFYKTTWVTYYGRPTVHIMGILGEYSIEGLTPRLRAQAAAYDEANGPELGVMPTFHLVYGMATKAPGEDGSYLNFLEDEVVLGYIEAAQREGWSVILDIQIGSLEPVDAVSRGFRWLEYDNVHLAMDPEFAMSHPGQERPGLPIGFVTVEEINAVQRAMRSYMKEQGIMGRRILIVHQFQDPMIVGEKGDIDRHYKIDLTFTADGWGGPWGKISKYNSFMNDNIKFTGFKLFYRWDEPLLTEREVLGIDMHPDVAYMNITPNLIIYQ
ncbi:MAG: LysM peptidoglycan-binding domain-containing protein [Chloroflexota bacterium]|nr:LysM peptidoglycan-binding domain-containing protein [Chloroflexota bacterium]